MPGFVLHVGATVTCMHGAPAQPTVPNPRVTASGQPVVTQPNPYTITGCPFNVSGSPSPCVTAQWTTAAARVRASGQPVLLQDSQSTCVPNGTPVTIVATQIRVQGI